MSIFSALALSFAPSLRSVAPPTLIVMNVAAIGALILARGAPAGDDASVFLLYIILSSIILVVSFASAALLARRRQSASPNANMDVLTVRISEDGVCHFFDDSAPCEQLGKYLLTKHIAQNRHIHIAVDRASKYELVTATLESLRGTGFKVGFVNYDPSSSH